MAALHERYLSTVYDRPAFARQLGALIEDRVGRPDGEITVLDCAAGTGFPALDLKLLGRSDGGPLRIHCLDGDEAMLAELERKAKEANLSAVELVPRGHVLGRPYNWAHLDRLDGRYDYVMCRGNSLVHDDSWHDESSASPSIKIAAPLQILDKLTKICGRVKAGGWLHVDAPRNLDSAKGAVTTKDGVTITEDVEAGDHHRKWTMTVEVSDAQPETVTLYSAPLTVYDLAEYLEGLGFVDLDPISLEGEREKFGVIVAQKPPAGD